MMTVYPYAALGRADHGWLDARHHFSFARYQNPERLGFGVLRVINDDIIAAGTGFAPHGHQDMEIITYVRQGAISHRDSMGNSGRTPAGDVQVMSAGTGIEHSEHNHEPDSTRLYQIWILPRENGIAPRWDSAAFPKIPVTGSLPLLVSGYADDAAQNPLYIHQYATIHGGRLAAGASITHALRHNAYILISEDSVTIDGTTLQRGDGAEITGQSTVSIASQEGAEILIIDVPPA